MAIMRKLANLCAAGRRDGNCYRPWAQALRVDVVDASSP